MQPVQDLTVEDRVSRTQFQYTLEDADADELRRVGAAARRRAAGAARAARRGQRSADRRPAGARWSSTATPPRASASRRRSSTTRSTTPSASGRSRRSSRSSTSTASSSKSRRLPAGPRRARSIIYVEVADGRARSRSSAFTRCRAGHGAAGDQPPGAVPGRHALVQPRARRRRSATPSTPSKAPSARSACPPRSARASRARPQAFQASLANEPLLILAALVTVYIVLGVLYESYIHPVTILSTLPSAGRRRASWRCCSAAPSSASIALIGIILLIGIVKKNAIMMIDFALDAEREEGKPPRRGDLPGVPAALPADHDDDHGGAARRPAAGARHGHRLRAAPPARHHDRRRPAPLAGAHALHHAGHLPRLRPAGATRSRQRRARPRGRDAGRRRTAA